MSDIIEAGPAATSQLEGGAVCYRFHPAGRFTETDTVEVFAGDYLVGSAPLSPDRRHGGALTARVPLSGMPALELPAELRAVVPRTGQEIAPVTTISDTLALLRMVGRPHLRAMLVAISDQAVTFELALTTLPGYPRELALHVTGAEVSRATSVLRDKKGNHEISFTTRGSLRDGDYVELMDIAADCPVHSMSITWMNLMEPLRLRLKQLEGRLESTETFLAQMRGRMEAVANVSRDRQLLERLDMFYALVNDRLDREIRWLAEQTLPATAVAVREEATTRQLPARSLDGVGVHNLESNGTSEWRWFGPRVMLIVRDVDTHLSGITLAFSSIGSGVDLAAVTVSINGVRIDADAGRALEHRHELVMEAPPGLVRQDRSLLVHLEFATAFHPPGDSRALCAAFVEAELFYN